MNPEKHSSVRLSRVRRAVAAFTLLAGCNALLDNDPRRLDDDAIGAAGQGGSPGSAGSVDGGNGGIETAGGVEAGGSAGVNGGAGANGGGAPQAGAPNGGKEGGEAGAGGASACSGECTPGKVDTMTQACTCNRGTQSRTRLCSSSCTWGQWGAFEACSVVAECQPGAAAQTRTVDCVTCKTKPQSRSCTSMCTWSAWTDTGTCPTDCDYCASVQWCTDPETGGTTCTQDDCTREQALRDCMLDIPIVCGATKQPFTMKYQ